MHGEINLYQSLYLSHLILCIHNVNTLNICMKKFDAIKSYFDKIELSNFLHFVSLEGFCLCSDSAYAGNSTCTTAFVDTV